MVEERFNSPGNRFGLQQLPVFTPDPGLWPRVMAGQLRQQRARRWKRGVACMAVAVLVCDAVVLLPGPQLLPQQAVITGQRESRALESQWLQVMNSTANGTPNLSSVRMIDADLQAAYDHGAGARAIAPLWRQRNEVLRGLIAQRRDADVHSAPDVTEI